MGACASKAPEDHRADRALHLATRRKEGWGASRGGEGTGRPAITASARADAPTTPPGVDEKMEEAGDSAPPVEEEEEEAPAPEPQTPRAPPPVPHLTLVFVGLDGAGKTAVIRALAANDGAGQRKSAASSVHPAEEGTLCAPPTTVAVTIHAGLRACGVSLDVVDVPGGGIVAGNARHVAWRRHLDALKVTPAPKESAPKEIAKRTTTTEPVVEVDCVVFVVDSADDLRMAVAREELWRLCGLVPPGDDASGGIRTLDRAAPANTLADSTAMLVLANKSDVSGALAAGEVADALDLDQLRAELGAVGVRVIGCEACSAVDGGGIERALEGALRRER